MDRSTDNMRIAIPVETFVREFNAKVLLSIKFAQNGHDIYIGESSHLNMGLDLVDPDIYMSNCNFVDRKIADKIRAKIFLLDSEGGVFRSDKEYSDRITADRLNNIDHYLAWGQKTADIVENNSSSTKITVTGNPRFDLLQKPLRNIYHSQSDQYQEKYGKYILVNTNFSVCNHHHCKSPPQNTMNRNKCIYNYNKNVFRHFIEMVSTFSAEFSNNIIVRPHPNENFSTYNSHFKNNDNVHVIHQGDVRNWIFGASAVIHNSCTTGIEAALLNIPVYAFDPVEPINSSCRADLPNVVSRRIKTLDKLIEEVQDTITTEKQEWMMNEKQRQTLKMYIDNLEYLSAERIVSVVESTETSKKKPSLYVPPLSEKLKRKFTKFGGQKLTNMLHRTKLKQGWSLADQKFPNIGNEHVVQTIEQFDDLVKMTGFNITRVPELENVFRIRQDSK